MGKPSGLVKAIRTRDQDPDMLSVNRATNLSIQQDQIRILDVNRDKLSESIRQAISNPDLDNVAKPIGTLRHHVDVPSKGPSRAVTQGKQYQTPLPTMGDSMDTLHTRTYGLSYPLHYGRNDGDNLAKEPASTPQGARCPPTSHGPATVPATPKRHQEVRYTPTTSGALESRT
ncbi:hypothetical protein ACLOJK_024120 [Asimina triloba]